VTIIPKIKTATFFVCAKEVPIVDSLLLISRPTGSVQTRVFRDLGFHRFSNRGPKRYTIGTNAPATKRRFRAASYACQSQETALGL
jgi:hypothetical protein